MLKLDYESDGFLAVIESDEDTAAWKKIRRAIRESSVFSSLEGATKIALPWHDFLTAREAISHYVRRYAVQVHITKSARAQLIQARKREENYRKATDTEPISPGIVKESLRAAGFERELTPEQLRNVCRIAGIPSAATFSVPGAGKTTEALAKYVLNDGFNKSLMVVAPKNAFPAWEEQLHLCLPNHPERFVRLTGGLESIRKTLSSTRPSMSLITYEQLIRVESLIGSFLSTQPSILYLDESHKIKRGPNGRISNTILSFSHLTDYKLILTGTPMPNSTADLVPQFQFLFPEIRADPTTVATLIQPIYVRTTKSELNLPKPLIRRIKVPLTPQEQALYDALRTEAGKKILGLKANERILLRKAGKNALRLLQSVSNPLLLNFGSDVPERLLAEAITEGEGSKLYYVCKRARELAKKGRKVVIWSSFVKNVELISQRLQDIGADYIHGGVSAGDEQEDDTREAKVKSFHDDDEKMALIANPAACGEGISLHQVCHDAIYVDRTYNAAQYLQSRDRIHRLGLPPDVTTRIELLIAPGTIDELVNRRLRAKVERMAKVLNDHGLYAEEQDAGDPDDPADFNFTLEDMRDLFRHLKVD